MFALRGLWRDPRTDGAAAVRNARNPLFLIRLASKTSPPGQEEIRVTASPYLIRDIVNGIGWTFMPLMLSFLAAQFKVEAILGVLCFVLTGLLGFLALKRYHDVREDVKRLELTVRNRRVCERFIEVNALCFAIVSVIPLATSYTLLFDHYPGHVLEASMLHFVLLAFSFLFLLWLSSRSLQRLAPHVSTLLVDSFYGPSCRELCLSALVNKDKLHSVAASSRENHESRIWGMAIWEALLFDGEKVRLRVLFLAAVGAPIVAPLVLLILMPLSYRYFHGDIQSIYTLLAFSSICWGFWAACYWNALVRWHLVPIFQGFQSNKDVSLPKPFSIDETHQKEIWEGLKGEYFRYITIGFVLVVPLYTQFLDILLQFPR